eukprot:CAMPEP_0180825636 /NCGR_PEP_ID=MMETSP1038_2-20121128/73087_1 /TAXON_ID=632150 /ORGANISM="Azadinium spinosum, Strain 3D9" /LENGTH=83 /DNA_ID=CAMNT_0022868133 /DNA_START=1 /DNA_END=252 /DNA_ORIENTATION=-
MHYVVGWTSDQNAMAKVLSPGQGLTSAVPNSQVRQLLVTMTKAVQVNEDVRAKPRQGAQLHLPAEVVGVQAAQRQPATEPCQW